MNSEISPEMKYLLAISNHILKTFDTNDDSIFNTPERNNINLSTLMNKRDDTLKMMIIKKINPYILSINNNGKLVESINKEIPDDLLELIAEYHESKNITIDIDIINTPYLPKVLTLGTNVTYHDPIENGEYHSHDVTFKVKRIIAEIYYIEYYDEWDSSYKTVWYQVNALWNKITGEYCFYSKKTNAKTDKLNSIVHNIFGDSPPLEIKEWNESTSVYLSKLIGKSISISCILENDYKINDDDWLRYDEDDESIV